MATHSAGFTALGFLDTGFLCPIEVGGGDDAPFPPDYEGARRDAQRREDTWRKRRRMRETMERVVNPLSPADTLPGAFEFVVGDDAITEIRAAMLAGQANAEIMSARRAYLAAIEADDEDVLLLVM